MEFTKKQVNANGLTRYAFYCGNGVTFWFYFLPSTGGCEMHSKHSELNMLQPVERGDIIAECPGAYLRKSRAQYTLVIEEPLTVKHWSRRKVNFEMALEKANKVVTTVLSS